MKLTITDKDLLLKPLQVVSGIVERRHTLPILSNVLIEIGNGKLTYVTTDLEIEAEAVRYSPDFENQEVLRTTVSVRKFLDILRALPSDTHVELTKLENRLQIVSGKSRFNLQLLPAEDFPRMLKEDEPDGISYTLTQQVFKKHLQRVQHAMAQQDLRYYLNGLLLLIEQDRLTMVATDTHRLALTFIPLENPFDNSETIVPRKTVLELAKQLEDSEKPVTIEVFPKKICFRFSDAVLISKVIAGKFIDFSRALPEDRTFQFSVNRLKLLHALQRIAIISNTNDLFRSVRLNIANNKISISAQNNEQEEAQEEVEIDYDQAAIDASFNIAYLIEVLNNLNSDNISCSFESLRSGILITLPDDERFKHILMPMRE
jgi:DNA polymerase III subunit beta